MSERRSKTALLVAAALCVLVGSGYGVLGGIPGNALIAFGTKLSGSP